MELILLLVTALIICFAFVVLFGAPYLPTLSPQIRAALDLAELKPGQHMIELGCGDGRVMVAALKQGARVTGYELNPVLALIAWLRTRRYKGRAKVVCGNFWNKQLPPAEVIFTFLLPKYMSKLDNKITQESSKPVKLISFAFVIPTKKASKEKQGVFLYYYK